MRLEILGWSRFFSVQKSPSEGLLPARVVEEQRGFYTVAGEFGEKLAKESGKIRHESSGRAQFPAVGDWVWVEKRPGSGPLLIHAVFERKTKISRKKPGDAQEEQVVAANVDTVFIITSLNQDLNLRRLERYLAIVKEGGAEPVIILSKQDLCPETAEALGQVRSVAAGAAVHALSALAGTGVEALEPYLAPGHTVVFIGMSGVGKSKLINRILNSDVQKTNEVRKGDSRGRHTTTARKLFILPTGGMVIDTPGMRELGLWTAEEGVSETFAEVEELAAHCRFRDCAHDKEPGCAVKKAVEDGSLPLERYRSFLKLKGELKNFSKRKEK